MKSLHRFVLAALGAAFFMASAQAQNAGTVSNHAIPIGKGPGVQGFGSLALTSGQVIIGQSSADPQAKTLSGDVTVDNTGTTAIGANKVTNSQLATMPANTTKCNATAGTANPTDCNASTMRTNLGLVIGTNVQAWDTDLDCLAAISSTGVISRTGGGTCSAGALALSGLATGTQDTVVGYFGSTTASATSVPNCSGSLTYSTSTHTFGCGAGATIPVFASRAVAAGQNLSAFSAITTQGYASPGDGGGATFIKLAAGSAFKDTYITAGTLAGGSGYTNATYLGVPFNGSTSSGCAGSATVTAGAVASMSIVIPCAGYKVGDVLTTPNTNLGGAGSGFSYTVTSISSPKASFTDSGGNLWQYVANEAAFPNVLQFGCVGDWNGSDASATNNESCMVSALAWASLPMSSASALVSGTKVVVPKGAFMICGQVNLGTGNISYYLPVAQGVTLSGAGVQATNIKECATNASSVHVVELCDSNALVGQFYCKVENLTLDSIQVVGSSSNIASIYSNSGQQFPLAENVQTIGWNKSCIKYEIGKGGAANDIWNGINCVQSSTASNPGFFFNAASVQHFLTRSVCASSGGGAANCINHLNGRLVVDGLDVEGYANGLFHQVTTVGNISSYKNVQENATSCTSAITLASGNIGGNIILENIATGCPTTVLNGQSGGSSYVGNIRGPTMCVTGACAAAVP